MPNTDAPTINDKRTVTAEGEIPSKLHSALGAVEDTPLGLIRSGPALPFGVVEVTPGTERLLESRLQGVSANQVTDAERLRIAKEQNILPEDAGVHIEVERRAADGSLDRLAPESLRQGIAEEEAALAALDRARQKRQEGIAQVAQWNTMIEALAQLQQRQSTVADALAESEAKAPKWKAAFLDTVGSDALWKQHLEAHLLHKARVPLLKEAQKHVAQLLKEHVQEMHAFATANNLPAELIAALPELPE